MTTRSQVLYVSYLFPPAGSVGVHRTIRFLKWLPELGWDPIVLTSSNARVDNLETNLVGKVSSTIPVHRAPGFEAFNYGKSLDGSKRKAWPGILEKFLGEIPRDIYRYLSIPDEKTGWIGPAVRLGREIIKKNNVEAIFVTGKPFSSFWIGHRLSQEFGIPWLMDLRDLWVLNKRMLPKTSVHGWLEARQERKLVQSASIVVANTPGNKRDFINAYPDCSPEKFVAITNGYDRDDFSNPSPEKFKKFTIAYTGTFYFVKPQSWYRRLMGAVRRKAELYETHSPKFIFQALKNLIDHHPELKDEIEMVIAGPACEEIKEMVGEYGLDANVRRLGWISHAESMNLIRQAHAACVTLSTGEESRGWIPSKLYPYLGSGSSILALVPEGDAADIVRETRSGVVVSPNDVEGIEAALWKLYLESRNETKQQSRNELVERYEGRALTEQLAIALDRAVGTSPRRLRSPDALMQREDKPAAEVAS